MVDSQSDMDVEDVVDAQEAHALDMFGGEEPGNPSDQDGPQDPAEEEEEPLLSPPSYGGLNIRAPGMGIDRARTMLTIQQRNTRQASQAGPSGHGGPGRGPIDDDARSVASELWMPGARDGHRGQPDEDDRSVGSRPNADMTYDGFDESIFKVDDAAVPLLRSQGELWTPITRNLGPHEMRPKRAMRVPIISDFFRRDADFFKQWQLPKGHESRARATASLVSMLFAGTAMGLPSGDHEERKRMATQEAELETLESQGGGGQGGTGKKKDPPPLKHVHRYTYVPGDEADSHPMFQIGLEELYNDRDQTEVLALAVWLFVSERPLNP